MRALTPRAYLPGLALLLVVAIPLVTADAVLLNILILIFLFATLGGAWNILGGYGGPLSLGPATYFGLGAYGSTLLLVDFGISPWLGALAGAAAAMALSLVLGLSCFRLRGPYFAIATIGVAEIMRLVVIDLPDVTQGARGVTLPFVGQSWALLQFRGKTEYYYLALGLTLATVAATVLVARSALGYRLRAIGQSEDAAGALGHDPAWTKQMANFVSAFFTAIAGTFYAQYFYYIEPNTVFGISLSIQIALVAIIGGVGTVWGPVLGAFILQSVAQLTQVFLGSSRFGGLQLLVYGVLLVAVILVQPRGVIGLARRVYGAACGRLPRWSRG